MKNGYGLEQSEYEKLVDRFYGFEEYYFYKKTEYYKDYKFILGLIDDIRNNKPMDTAYKNAIIGYWISFRKIPRQISNELSIMITDTCQLKCKHCYNQDTPRKNKFMTYDEFVFLFNKHQELRKHFIHTKDKQKNNIALLGGEIMLNPYLYDIMKFIFHCKDTTMDFVTNGLYIPDNILNLLVCNKNRVKIQISIDGLKETHEFIRGEGTYDKSVATLNKLIDLGLDVHTNTVINSLNYKDYKEIVDKKIFNCYSRSLFYSPQNTTDIKICTKEELNSIGYDNFYPCISGTVLNLDMNGVYNLCLKTGFPDVVNLFTDDIETCVQKIKKSLIRYRPTPVYCFDCKKVDKYFGCMPCNNITRETYNTEDAYCHILGRKEIGDMYRV